MKWRWRFHIQPLPHIRDYAWRLVLNFDLKKDKRKGKWKKQAYKYLSVILHQCSSPWKHQHMHLCACDAACTTNVVSEIKQLGLGWSALTWQRQVSLVPLRSVIFIKHFLQGLLDRLWKRSLYFNLSEMTFLKKIYHFSSYNRGIMGQRKLSGGQRRR